MKRRLSLPTQKTSVILLLVLLILELLFVHLCTFTYLTSARICHSSRLLPTNLKFKLEELTVNILKPTTLFLTSQTSVDWEDLKKILFKICIMA